MATESPTQVKADSAESLEKLKIRKKDVWRFRGKMAGSIDLDPDP